MSQESMTTPSGAFPRVSFDINHGKYVDDIDVDFDTIVKQLREGGLSDEEIADLSIHFSAKQVERFGATTTGVYLSERKTFPKRKEQIKVGHPDILNYIGKNEEEHTSADVDFLSKHASEQYSDSLAHELEHAVAKRDPEQQLLNKEHKGNRLDTLVGYIPSGRQSSLFAAAFTGLGTYAKFGGEAIPVDSPNTMYIAAGVAVIALNGLDKVLQRDEREYRQYRDCPEERRAWAAGAAAPHNLVSISMKEKPDTRRDVTKWSIKRSAIYDLLQKVGLL